MKKEEMLIGDENFFEELCKVQKESSEKAKGKAVLYKKPTGKKASVYCMDRADSNGKPIWINWYKWLAATNIDKPENLKLLPTELSKYVSKWEKAFLKRKQEDFCPANL